MSSTASAHAPSNDHAHGKHDHALPLWGLFLALLAFTAAEVGLFEVWHRTQQFNAAGEVTWQLMPKFAMVLVIFLFTIPKAIIVLVYFMHIKFEKWLVVLLAILPFGFAGIAVLPTLIDIKTLKADNKTYNFDPKLPSYSPIGGHGGEHKDAHGEKKEKPAPPAPKEETY